MRYVYYYLRWRLSCFRLWLYMRYIRWQGRRHGLPSLDQWTDGQVIEGFLRLRRGGDTVSEKPTED